MTPEKITEVCREMEGALRERMKADEMAHQAAQAVMKAHKRLQMARHELTMIDKNNEKMENEDMAILEEAVIVEETNMEDEPIQQLEYGLPPKIWNEVLDRYLTESVIDSNLYLQMSDAQVYVIQELKRSFKRIKYSITKETDLSTD